jgi:hypothetical protein
MTVYIESCWSGGDRFSYRLVFKVNGHWCRDAVPGMLWTRKVVTRALDTLEHTWKLTRRNIRFVYVTGDTK